MLNLRSRCVGGEGRAGVERQTTRKIGMENEAGEGSVRVIEASVEVVRTEVIKRSLVFAFPAAMEEGLVESIARECFFERADGVDITKHVAEGYVLDEAATDGIMKMELLAEIQEELIDVVLEARPGGTVLVKRRHYFPEIIDPRTWD
jgi:hypothetical protein